MNRRSFFGAMVGAPAAVMAPGPSGEPWCDGPDCQRMHPSCLNVRGLLTPVATGPGGYIADVCGQPTSISAELVAHWRGLMPPLPPPWRDGY